MMAELIFFSFISLISLCLSRINSPVGNPVYLKSLSHLFTGILICFLLTMEVIDGFVLHSFECFACSSHHLDFALKTP